MEFVILSSQKKSSSLFSYILFIIFPVNQPTLLVIFLFQPVTKLQGFFHS